MKICAIIPTFNRKACLKSLLDQLKKQKLDNILLDIVVVVDGSTDGTLEMLSDNYPNIYVIRGDGNWWYTKSMNEGFQFAEKLNPDFVLCMNDDVEIEENYLQNLYYAVKNVKPNSIVGSISYTLETPPKLISSGIKFIKWWRNKPERYHKLFSNINPESLTGVHKSIVLPGRGMLIPFRLLKELNFFDEYFVQYHSDADFCLRAQKKGYEVYISWDARVFCHAKKTAGTTSFLRSSFHDFILSFFNKHSRRYLPHLFCYNFRHGPKIIAPLRIVITIIASFKAYFFSKKI